MNIGGLNLKNKTHVFIIFGLITLIPLLWFEKFKRRPLPVLGQVQSFALMDSQMKDQSLDSLLGKVWVADFVFTTCAGPCPLMSQKMAELHRSYLLEDDVRMVTFTVNPEYDSPQVLSDYAKEYKANTDRWWFLTGERATIERLAIQDFKVGSVEQIAFHSTYFVLVDRSGRIRGYYDATDAARLRQLFVDIAFLMKEAPAEEKD